VLCCVVFRSLESPLDSPEPGTDRGGFPSRNLALCGIIGRLLRARTPIGRQERERERERERGGQGGRGEEEEGGIGSCAVPPRMTVRPYACKRAVKC